MSFQTVRARLREGLGHRLAIPLLIGVLTLLMTLRTLSKGWDFVVFWEVSRNFLDGMRSPYDLEQYGNMVFKYPPWILPFFLPLALLPLAIAKGVWGLVQGVSLFAVVHATRREVGTESDSGRVARTLVLLLLLFSGIWLLHGMVGQVTLAMLALSMNLPASLSRSGVRGLTGLTALSAKVLTVFPLIAFLNRPAFWKKVVWAMALFVLLSFPLVWSYDRSGNGVVQLIRDWWHSSFSGTQAVGQIRIGFTTREAQGIPSLLLRVFNLNEENRPTLLTCLAVSAMGVAAFGAWRLRRLPEHAKWLGWLALTPLVQPLAWFHFFSFAYPWLAWSLVNRPRQQGWLWFSAVLVAAVTEKTLGPVGLWLEMASIKSLGVLLAVWLGTREER